MISASISSRRRAGLLALVSWLLLGLSTAAIAGPEGARRPNILFLFSDDQRADALGAAGNTVIRTPNQDRLAAEGTLFTRAYCMGGSEPAVCAPSRAMLMSGRGLFRMKVDLANQGTWAERFGQAGYRTFISGKWHNGPEALLRSFQEGKDVFLGGMGNPYKLPVADISADHKLANKHIGPKHSVELFSDAAADFLLAQKGSDKPFLCYVAYNAPHDPRMAPAEYHAASNKNMPPLPADFLPEHPFDNGEMTIRDEQLAPWPRTPDAVRQALADYYASIAFMDVQIGRVLEALKQSGQYENTLVVFSSDHGLAIGSHGLMGKQNLYDQSMHAPLIISGPGVPKGKQCDALCYLLDIFPTLGELADVQGPMGSEGSSLVAAMKGAAGPRQALLTSYREFQRAVRDDRWKLIAYPKINKMQLFDLRTDPNEMKDLAADPAFAAELTRMTTLLKQQQEAAGDHQPLTTDKPQPWQFDFSKAKRAKE